MLPIKKTSAELYKGVTWSDTSGGTNINNNLKLKIMEKYNYLEAVKENVEGYLTDEVDLSKFDSVEELSDFLNDELLTNDSVTGNASGSYTFSIWQAEEYLCHNTELFQEAAEEFGGKLVEGAEAQDVTIRCYLLPEAIEKVLENYEIEGKTLEEYFDNKE